MNTVLIKNIIVTILLLIIPISIGFFLIFQLVSILPGDPVLAYLAARGYPSPTQPQYDAAVIELGFNLPLIVQYLRFIGEFFIGNLGISTSIDQGTPVIEVLTQMIPTTLGLMIVPIVLGLILGIIFGILSVKVRNKLVKTLVQFLVILGISMPMFLAGMIFQYTFSHQLGLFPATGLSFLPMCVLFLLTLFLTTRQVRSNYMKKSEEKNILSNSLQIIINIFIITVSIILLESTFIIDGFFRNFILAIMFSDFWLVRACLVILFLSIVVVLFLSNFGYIIYNYFSEGRQTPIFTKYFEKSEQMIEEAARYDLNSEQGLKDFFVYRLKSPLTIIGMAIVVFFIIVAIFPQVLTPISRQDVFNIDFGAWSPPSATHPLGQTNYGRDVLALLVYGVSTSIQVCIVPVLIGMAIGVLFGYLAKVHWGVRDLILGIMIILLIPSLMVLLIFSSVMGSSISVMTNFMAMCATPGFTLVVSNGEYNPKLAAKKLITYIPLFMAFNILLFGALGYLGLSDPSLINLGYHVAEGRLYLFDAPWASLWPGIALYTLVIGFLLLHYGLKEPIPITERILIARRTKTNNEKIIEN